jgi:DNA-binding GntR family transcriptional regulator
VVELQTQTLVDTLSEAVSRQVLNGDIPAGASVTEKDIAELFDVARPTAKAAIERLVQSGILGRSANKTARVPVFSDDDVEDLYSSRIFFEGQVVAGLAVSGTVPREADAALSSMRRALDSGSRTDAVEADVAFHRALVSGLGSNRLVRMLDTILGEAHLCIAQERAAGRAARETSDREHRAILRAIEAKDVEESRSLLVQHLATAAERLIGRPFTLRPYLLAGR